MIKILLTIEGTEVTATINYNINKLYIIYPSLKCGKNIVVSIFIYRISSLTATE